jgi:hypothetical protein
VQGLEPIDLVRRRLTEHVADVDHDRTCLGRDGSELITDGVVIVTLASWADFESILSVTLEKERQTSNIGVVPGTPCSGGILRSHVVNQTHLREVVWSSNIHGFVEMVLGKAKSNREASHLQHSVRSGAS